MSVWGTCLLVLSVCLLSSCSLFGDEGTSELVQNLRRWKKADLHDYDFTLQVLCFCPPYGPADVAVRSDEVWRVTLSPSEYVMAGDTASFVLTIDDLFDIVMDLHNKTYQLDVDYDRELGYPTRIAIDRAANTADDEVTYLASNLRPLIRID